MTKIITTSIFSENLKRIRGDSGLTQEKTVKELQLLGSTISRSTYSLIEMGRGNIFISVLVGLQQIFGVDYSEFFFRGFLFRDELTTQKRESKSIDLLLCL